MQQHGVARLTLLCVQQALVIQTQPHSLTDTAPQCGGSSQRLSEQTQQPLQRVLQCTPGHRTWSQTYYSRFQDALRERKASLVPTHCPIRLRLKTKAETKTQNATTDLNPNPIPRELCSFCVEKHSLYLVWLLDFGFWTTASSGATPGCIQKCWGNHMPQGQNEASFPTCKASTCALLGP